jgi:hypothetical protein
MRSARKGLGGEVAASSSWLPLLLLLRSVLLIDALPGVPPGGGVTFFCGARRKSPKKRP